MIWNEKIETMPRGELEQLQDRRLRSLVKTLAAKVPFYEVNFRENDIDPDTFKGLEELHKLPFTHKSDLRDHYPFGLFAEPMDKVARIHASSGTTGKPTVVGYTKNDLDHWAEVCARSFALSGTKPGQMFQNAYGYGLFTGGLGMHYGAERMGLTVIPVSGGNTARQILLLQDFKPDTLACTPSYALTLADRIIEEGIDFSELNLKTLILGAEPWTEEMRQAVEEKLPVNAVNIYGLSEIIGPGVSNECVEAKNGSHVFEDHFIVEAVDPQTGVPVPDGEIGELTFTTLTKEAIPLLRYRTGDLASIDRSTCICGRTHARMSRIIGRRDDMLIIRGVNVYPSQIETVILGQKALGPHHQIVLSRKGHLDHVEVLAESPESLTPSVREEAKDLLCKGLAEMLGLNVPVRVEDPGVLPRSEGGKLSRVIDKRI